MVLKLDESLLRTDRWTWGGDEAACQEVKEYTHIEEDILNEEDAAAVVKVVGVVA